MLSVTAAAALTVTAPVGCGFFDNDPEPIPEPDPLQPVLDEARALAAAYDRLAAAQPDLSGRITPLADDHRAHAAELERLVGASPAASTAPSAGVPVAGTLAEMRTAEQAAARTANASARTAPADRAMLIGSIAACRATHVEALR